MVAEAGDGRQQFEARQKSILDRWEEMSSNAGEVQEQVLRDILSTNAGCQYLHRFQLDGRTDVASFRSSLPLIHYEDIEPDIRRLVEGERAPVLSAHPPVAFVTSSGTSRGLHKLFPTVEGDAQRRGLADSLLRPMLNRHVPGLDQGKCLYFLFSREATKLPSGLLCLPVVSWQYRGSVFQKRPYDPSYVMTSPDQLLLCTDSAQVMYCHLLLGLVQSQEVMRIGAIMASTLIRALRLLEDVWQELCEDIASGSVSSRVTDPTLRDVCGRFLHNPDPQLAAQVRAACETGTWAGIVPRLWPNTKLMDVVATGSMEAYVPALHLYGGPVIKVVSGQLYGSSECFMGVNTRPLDPPCDTSYTLIPSNAYYEFIPIVPTVSDGPLLQQRLQPVPLVDVEVGQEYELVVTTHAGLYRYRMGDILRCSGHYNKAPQFYFVGRASVALAVDYDKTTERELLFSITQASKHLQEVVGKHLHEYSSYCDMSSSPGHYVIFWELSDKDTRLADQVLERCCSIMEKSFNAVYCGCRREKTIGPLELRLVERGAFDHLANFAISQGSSIAQYKPPRCLKQQAMVDLLNARVLQTYFSTSMPEFKLANFTHAS